VLEALRGKVRAVLDAGLPRGAARVAVTLADGRRAETTVLHARGSAERPLDDAALDAKFRANAALGGLAERADAAIAAVRGLAAAPEVGTLMALLRR
jgi:hypothetical protein